MSDRIFQIGEERCIIAEHYDGNVHLCAGFRHHPCHDETGWSEWLRVDTLYCDDPLEIPVATMLEIADWLRSSSAERRWVTHEAVDVEKVCVNCPNYPTFSCDVCDVCTIAPSNFEEMRGGKS